MLHAAARHEDTQQRLFPTASAAQHNRTCTSSCLPDTWSGRAEGTGQGARTTLVMSRMARPRMAAATALTPTCAPKIHSPTVRPSAPAVIFSLRDSGPSFSSSSLRSA